MLVLRAELPLLSRARLHRRRVGNPLLLLAELVHPWDYPLQLLQAQALRCLQLEDLRPEHPCFLLLLQQDLPRLRRLQLLAWQSPPSQILLHRVRVQGHILENPRLRKR